MADDDIVREESHRYDTAVGFYFRSLEWMRVALAEFKQRETEGDYVPTRFRPYSTVIGQVCFGYAMEFAYKALLLALENGQFKSTHRVAELHGSLSDEHRSVIEDLALKCVDTEPFLGFAETQTMTSILARADSMTSITGIQVIGLIDRYCSHKNVKYLGVDRKLKRTDFVAPIVDTSRIEQLRAFHGGVLQLARELLLPYSEGFPTLAEVQLDD